MQKKRVLRKFWIKNFLIQFKKALDINIKYKKLIGFN